MYLTLRPEDSDFRGAVMKFQHRMKPIFTFVLMAAALGAGAAVPEFTITDLPLLTPNGVRAAGKVFSRAGENLPEPKTGEYLGLYDYDFTDGYYSIKPQECSIVKTDEGYSIQLGIGGVLQNMNPLSVPLQIIETDAADPDYAYSWGIPIDGSAVVLKDVELHTADGGTITADVFVAGCAVADINPSTGRYTTVGWAPTPVTFDVTESGDFFQQTQQYWIDPTGAGISGTAITGIAMGCMYNGEVSSIGMNFFEPMYFQPNAIYEGTLEGSAQYGSPEIVPVGGDCYVAPFSDFSLGSGYMAFGVSDNMGALVSVTDGDEVTGLCNLALYAQGSPIYWGDSMNPSGDYAAEGTLKRNGGHKMTISYPEINLIIGDGSEIATYTDLTLTFDATDALEQISVDDSDMSVEYYSLEGLRLAEPAPGQIVICRRGSRIEKMVVNRL